jgi:glycosyltransferase involved in cell wall biosynthesis
MLGAGLDAFGGVSTMSRLLARRVPATIHLTHVATMVEGSRWRKGAAFLRASTALAAAASLRTVDIVHLHMAVRGSVIRKILFGAITSTFRLPTVIHAHGGDFDNWYRNRSPRYQARVRHLLASANRVIVLSESWKRFYVSACSVPADRVEVLPNPVELPASIPERGHSGIVHFLYLGAMDDRKGAFRALDGFASLAESDRFRARLLIAGNGRVGEMRSLVAEKGLSDLVTVRDWVGPEERDRLLAESDVYVLPSSNEGMPMGMLEAMSWGLPVLTSPVGGIPEVVEHRRNGLLVDAFDITAITAAYREFIRDDDARRRMGLEARRTVEPLDIDRYWQTLIDVYSRALSEPPPRTQPDK